MSTLIRNGLVLLVDGAGWKTEKKAGFILLSER